MLESKVALAFPRLSSSLRSPQALEVFPASCPYHIGRLTSARRSLHLSDCTSMEYFPDSFSELTSLKKLHICPIASAAGSPSAGSWAPTRLEEL